VAGLRTEEEQFEALKGWWKSSGRSFAVSIVLAIVAVMGWNYWQARQQAETARASDYYQRILGVLQSADGQLEQEDIATVNQLATQLRNDYGDSAYAIYTALVMARLAVQQNELLLAQQQLQWVLDQQPDAELMDITRIRMARVLAASGDLDKALTLLDDKVAPAWESSRLQAQGDILLQKGDRASALEAYKSAQEMVDTTGMFASLLRLKLNDTTE
jgi:predicted negative regulator of RcsB-dependent stress response